MPDAGVDQFTDPSGPCLQLLQGQDLVIVRVQDAIEADIDP